MEVKECFAEEVTSQLTPVTSRILKGEMGVLRRGRHLGPGTKKGWSSQKYEWYF